MRKGADRAGTDSRRHSPGARDLLVDTSGGQRHAPARLLMCRSLSVTYDRVVTPSPADPPASAPALSVNRAEYAPGRAVTFTGTGWDRCPFGITVKVVHGTEFTVIGVYEPENGSFMGTFAAPSTPGTYTVDANAEPPGCSASIPFEVVADPS
jgi:hypothetical protein